LTKLASNFDASADPQKAYSRIRVNISLFIRHPEEFLKYLDKIPDLNQVSKFTTPG
jgi:hypothetical protein